jgi:hypothetical protein
MTRTVNGVLLVALLSGCNVGPRGESTALALAPRGAQIELETGSGALRGELLEMRGTGVVLLAATNQVTLVEYEAIRRGHAENGPSNVTGAGMRSGRAFETLRRKSRFPQGLNTGVEARLLAAYGQDSLVVVRP